MELAEAVVETAVEVAVEAGAEALEGAVETAVGTAKRPKKAMSMRVGTVGRLPQGDVPMPRM